LVRNDEAWERQLTFSFSNISNFENQCVVGTLKIDTVTSTVENQLHGTPKTHGTIINYCLNCGFIMLKLEFSSIIIVIAAYG
jgi:hypothetical protein